MEEINKAYAMFQERDRIASLGGGVEKIEKQHESGKMTARERIEMLLNKGTFVELDKLMVHRCTNYGMDKTRFRETASYPVTERLTAPGICLCLRLYCLRRFTVRFEREKDCESAATGIEERCSDNCAE